ncbi:MAG: hypothetical protein M4579_002000 [Chaenotheca gracillima]|nr:MAG: hypothetical protein M4579_002000 [Chaenotheca gracillima]
MNQNHRVTRRKSMSSTTANNQAAMAAALKEAGEAPLPSSLPSNRRSLNAKVGGASSRAAHRLAEQDVGDQSFAPRSVPGQGASALARGREELASENGSAVTDGPPLQSHPDHAASMSKARIRRASEGSHLSKPDGKRVSGGELRCEKCGKGYKHSSCLTKHLWEHTPEWSLTSKLLISKHQQVQLLEAASVLVGMNQDEETPPPSAKDFAREDSSASPSASGSSGRRDGMSSTDTTPPPAAEETLPAQYSSKASRSGRVKRRSSNSSSFSRSTRTNSISVGSAPSYSSVFSHHRHTSGDPRPLSSGSMPPGDRDEDEAGLAAAVELLSCGFGTPRSGPITMPQDVPPVPPLPARFQGANISQTLSGGTLIPSYNQQSFQGHVDTNSRDVDMDDSESSNVEDEDDSDRRSVSKGPSDGDDDGIIFGGMEQ